jgi:hypothetical protein
VRGIDHPALGRTALGGKGCEDAVEPAHTTPAEEAVVGVCGGRSPAAHRASASHP